LNNLDLFTNRNSKRDYVVNAIEGLTNKPCSVYIAVAFFTEANIVERLVEKGCRVRLIVRLEFPTQAQSLEKLLNNPGVEIRYFTDSAFHPKIYLFGNQTALVGSANLTGKAINTNQEVVVLLGSEDHRLNDLMVLFQEYWSQAKVLTEADLAEYQRITAKLNKFSNEQQNVKKEVIEKLGRIFAGDIIADKVKQSKENIYLEDFRKTYQETVSAFNVLCGIYERAGKRKIANGLIPLRLEIDSFISFIRDEHAFGEAWESAPLKTTDEVAELIEPLISEWFNTPWPHFEEKIVKENYPRLMNVFSDTKTIQSSSDDELFNALCTCHSFHDRFRYFLGGMPTWKNHFLKANDTIHTRESLSYLLYGKGSIEERMTNMIYNPAYKLDEFGQANVQELIGWCNKENLPVINGRTTKVLRWLGFDVRQVGE
jgi:HKD family nuclease